MEVVSRGAQSGVVRVDAARGLGTAIYLHPGNGYVTRGSRS